MTSQDSTPAHATIIVGVDADEPMSGPRALLAVRWGEGPGELPLAIAHAKAHLDGGAERVVIVVRPEAARVLAPFGQRGVELAVAPHGSPLGIEMAALRTALGLVLYDPAVWIAICPVGSPPISEAIRREILSTIARDESATAIRPTFDGKVGHPVFVRRDQLACIDPQSPEPRPSPAIDSIAALLESLGAGVVGVEVPDRRAVTRFDVPADVEHFYGRQARFFADDEPSFAG